MAKGKFSQPRMPKYDGSIPDQNVDPVLFPDDAFPELIDDSFSQTPDQVLAQTQEFSLEKEAIPAQRPQAEPIVYNSDEDQLSYAQQLAQEAGYPEITPEEPEPEPAAVMDNLFDFFYQNQKLILVGLCAAALLLIIVVNVFFLVGNSGDPYDGKILNNVMVAGVNVGGMSKAEAQRAVKAVTDGTYTQYDMVLELPDTTLRFSPDDTGAELDVEGAIQAAFDYGRTGTQAEKDAAFNASLTGNHTIGLLPYLQLNERFIQDALKEYASQFGTIYQEASYTLEGEMPELRLKFFDETAPCQTLVITLGTPGMSLDLEGIYNDILDAYSLNTFLVKVDAVAAEAVPEDPDLDAIHEEVYIAPVDTVMDMQTYESVPGSYGYGFNIDEAQKLVDKAGFGESVRIPMEYIEPAVLDEDLLFRDVLGSCETSHTKNENRTHNLVLACEAINGLVLKPGETFSYNNTLGERTAAKGYKTAPAHIGYNVVDQIGGGISQGASTLYYSALMADMEITARINHDHPVNYIAYGLDATISWGGADLKFKNTTNFPIKIEAEVADGKVKVKILGTDERDYYVKLDYEITKVSQPDTKYQIYTSDNLMNYEDGDVLVAGATGYQVKTYKLKYDRETNQLLSKDYITTSYYKKVDRIEIKIEDPEESTEETTPETTESTEPTGTTSPSETTTAPSETTQPTETPPPAESTTAPTESTAAPTESTAAPTESTAAPTESSAAPTESTAAPTESKPPETTPAPPPESTQGETPATQTAEAA